MKQWLHNTLTVLVLVAVIVLLSILLHCVQSFHYEIPGDCVDYLECKEETCKGDVRIHLRHPPSTCVRIVVEKEKK